MLADSLERARERLLDEAQAGENDPPSSAGPSDRREHLQALLDELIGGLRGGAVDECASPTTSCTAGAEERAREGLRRAVLAEVERRRLEVSLAELVIVADWSSAVERRRLREESRRFSAVLDGLDDAVVLVTLDRRVAYLNRRAARDTESATGRPADRVIGRTSFDIGFPPELSRRFDELAKRASAGEVIAEDLSIPFQTGTRWVEAKLAPIYRSDGTIAAVSLVSRDIHDRKVAQMRFQLLSKVSSLVGLGHEELLESVARLAIPELADWSSVQVIESNLIRGRFLAQRDPAKAALRDELGRTPLQPPGEWWRELEDGRSVLLSEVSESWLRQRAVDERHFRLLMGMGLRSLLMVPVWTRGELSALLTFTTTAESGRRYGPDDVALGEELARRAGQIIDNARLQEELEQAAVFRERMIGIIGHDLRNPLNAIAMAAALLGSWRELPQSFRDQAQRIDHAARRMAEMIGTLLDFAQARFRGSLPVSPVPADLAEITRETVEELRGTWPGRQIEIVLRGDPRGEWDPARIAQVVSNLVANALTHGAADAPVHVLIEGDAAEARLTVHNTGPAIPSTLIPVLFEPFRRGTNQHGSRGVGLGLYIARQIVHAHDGNIDVTSSPGDGTRFTVRLPRVVTLDAHAH